MKMYEIADVDIVDIKLTNRNTNASINPSEQIISLDVYEDINAPSLYAEIFFDDKIGLLNDFPIIGEEEFEITFKTPGLPYPTTYKFRTFSLTNVQQNLNTKGYTFCLKCVSKEQLTQSNINITQSYNETIDDIVRNIFDRYLQTDKILDIDPCKGTETIVFPKLFPFQCVDLVRKRASHPKFTSSAYVFFENQNGFNFKCIEQLMEDGKLNVGSKKYYHFPTGQLDKNTEALMFRNIIDYETLSRTDLTEIIQDGGIKNKVKTFDIFTKTVEEKTFDMTQKFSSLVTLDKRNSLSISDTMIKDFADKPTFNFFIPKDSNRKQNFLEDMLGAKRAFLKFFNSNSVRIQIPGDTSLKVGDVVELNLPVSTGTTENKSDDKLVGGNYIIVRLRHNVTTSGKLKHYISMDCNKLGFA